MASAGDLSLIKELRKKRGLTQAQLGRLLEPPEAQQKIDRIENGQTQLSALMARKLSRALGVDSTVLLNEGHARTVPVIGYVGASNDERVAFIDDHERGAGLEEIEAPPGAHDGFALGVRGNSMVPRFFEGEYVFYRRALGNDPRTFLHRDCVVRLRDGRTVLKRVEPGTKRGFYTLRSYNPAVATVPDAKIEWIAPVVWVKPR